MDVLLFHSLQAVQLLTVYNEVATFLWNEAKMVKESLIEAADVLRPLWKNASKSDKPTFKKQFEKANVLKLKQISEVTRLSRFRDQLVIPANEVLFSGKFEQVCQDQLLSIKRFRLKSGELLVTGPHVVNAYICIEVC